MSATTPLEIKETLTAASGVPRYELRPWAEAHGVSAGVTAGGDEGLDFGLGAAQPVTAVLDQWARLMDAVGTGLSSAVVARQVHGREVSLHGAGLPAGLLIQDATDGHVTAAAGTLLAVTVADCVPVYLLERTHGAVALLHAGWRGVAAGVLEAGLAQLLAASSGAARNTVMHCGISICGRCYEVGPEVPEALGLGRPRGKSRLDLRAVLADRASTLGIEDVTVSGWCTAHDQGRFHSHRASGGRAGRMAAYLARPPA